MCTRHKLVIQWVVNTCISYLRYFCIIFKVSQTFLLSRINCNQPLKSFILLCSNFFSSSISCKQHGIHIEPFFLFCSSITLFFNIPIWHGLCLLSCIPLKTFYKYWDITNLDLCMTPRAIAIRDLHCDKYLSWHGDEVL